MARAWIYSWNKDGWKEKTQSLQFGEPHLTYAASNEFKKRGVAPGDTLFIVNVRNQCLYLGGSIAVAEILSREEAAVRLGKHRDELWKATDYVIADPSRLDRFRPACRVPDEVIDDLWLIDAKCGQRTPKRDGNGGVDVQTFRALRELVPGEDGKLLRLLC